jgi:PAS domain S-box-containing protein
LKRSLLSLCFLFLVASRSPALGIDSTKPKNLLILSSYSKALVDPYAELLRSSIRSRVPGPVNFYVEYLESQRLENRDYENGVNETLRDAYAKEKPDIVIAISYTALRFAAEFRDRMFPGVPIIFLWVGPGRLQDGKLWPGVTGITAPVDVRGTVELAVRLHPGARNVAVVAGDSETEHYWLGLTHQELHNRANQLNEIDLVGLPTEQLLQRVSTLPATTIVLFQYLPQESSDRVVGTYDILAAVAQRFPTYCIHNICLDHGGIGGSYPDSNEQVATAGQMVARVLTGEKPENIPMVHGKITGARVDWRQLLRWNIAESALPANTLVLYRQPTVWQRYWRYMFAGIVAIVAQSLLIIGLLWQRARKRKAEAVLRESEKRFRVMADTTPSLVWMCNPDGNVTYLNDRRVNFTGRDPDAGFADTWTAYIHPDDVRNVLAVNARALEKRQGFSKEYRLRRRDGAYRWMLDVAAPRVNGDGSFAGFIGAANDITDQKLAQEALEKVGGRLIEAQEKERSRIARELHDDICQRLALLSLELEQTKHSANGSSAERDTQMTEIQRRCSQISADVQVLSHQLHSSKLDYLGIVAALRSFCKEFSQQKSVSIEFTSENVPNPLPRDVSLCLFRVAQEALHNAVKYSGVTLFSVDLRGIGDQLRLEVGDTGVGFDVEKVKQDVGLGLISMQERIHLINGRLDIKSKANHGTTIVARVPSGSEGSGVVTIGERVDPVNQGARR